MIFVNYFIAQKTTLFETGLLFCIEYVLLWQLEFSNWSMKKILYLAFVLFASVNILAQEKTTDNSEPDKVRSSPAVKAEGKVNQNSTTNEKSDEIIEVSFERTGCMGWCPIDKVTFRLNGSHSYNGIKYVDRIGNYQADLQELKISALVRVLERLNYRNLKDNYVNAADAQVVILNVVRQGSSKTIKAVSSSDMPVEMQIIQIFIECVTPKIAWKKLE